MISPVTIDDDVRHTGLGGSERDSVGRADREGGAEGDDEVTGVGCGKGAGEVGLAQVLAETDGGGLEKTAAFADGRLPGYFELREAGLDGIARAANLAFGE